MFQLEITFSEDSKDGKTRVEWNYNSPIIHLLLCFIENLEPEYECLEDRKGFFSLFYIILATGEESEQ